MTHIIFRKNILFNCVLGWAMVLGGNCIPTDTWAQIVEVQEAGQELFVQHCAACHGTNAKGTGPLTSQVKGIPPNLTELAKLNNGKFPFWRVYRIIDGREQILKHGPREMPAWGNWFQIPEDEGHGLMDWRDQVRGRLWQLLMYLESIQQS